MRGFVSFFLHSAIGANAVLFVAQNQIGRLKHQGFRRPFVE
jgi:hypothetical protein